MKNHFIYKTKAIKKDKYIKYGILHLLSNGKVGIRGIIADLDKSYFGSINLNGVYDQSDDKWIESVNLPNFFYFQIYSKNRSYRSDSKDTKKFVQSLNASDNLLENEVVFDDLKYSTTLTLERHSLCFFAASYKLVVHNSSVDDVTIKSSINYDIFETNGPHFKKTTSRRLEDLTRKSITLTLNNDRKIRVMYFRYIRYQHRQFVSNAEEFTIMPNESIEIMTDIWIDDISFLKKASKVESRHIKDIYFAALDTNLSRLFKMAEYQMNSLLQYDYLLSIPARSLSGSTYKGAVFWDTEIFLVPYYLATNPDFAKILLMYRINGLKEALKKAESYNYKGAFYAWESGENGLELCSDYNVTDPITDLPIRTYFKENQIHISADIVYAVDRYVRETDDLSLLNRAFLMIKEIAIFYISRAVKKDDELYHFNSVMGPDEYHEAVDDNAFTNYMIHFVFKTIFKYKRLYSKLSETEYQEFHSFMNSIYLPGVNDQGIVEQFSGYYELEETTIEELNKRKKHPNEYLGLYAKETKIIKQADVITLIALFQDKIEEMIPNINIKNNFDYYYKYTEHGSSLSASMYGIVALKIGYYDLAKQLLYKTLSVDIDATGKEYAGGVYIGGTHIASYGGAFLMILDGYLRGIIDNKIDTKAIESIGLLMYVRLYKGEMKRYVVGSIKSDNI